MAGEQDPFALKYMKLKRWISTADDVLVPPDTLKACTSPLALLQVVLAPHCYLWALQQCFTLHIPNHCCMLLQALRDHGMYQMSPHQLAQLDQMQQDEAAPPEEEMELRLDSDLTSISQQLPPDSGEIQVAPVGSGSTLRVVVISDTHNHHRSVQVPPGDVLIHCGDFTNKGKVEELTAFNDWLGELPHAHKFLVVGNHEVGMFNEWEPALVSNATFVDNDLVEVAGVRMYGMPWKGEVSALAFLWQMS